MPNTLLIIAVVQLVIIVVLMWLLYKERTFCGVRIPQLFNGDFGPGTFVYDKNASTAVVRFDIGKVSLNLDFGRVDLAGFDYGTGNLKLSLRFKGPQMGTGTMIIENGTMKVTRENGETIGLYQFKTIEDRLII